MEQARSSAVMAVAMVCAAAIAHAQPAPAGDGSTPLHWAAYEDDLSRATALMGSRANVNAANDLGATPLWVASVNGSAPMVSALLKWGADPNIPLLSGETALMAAARSGKTTVVEQLLKNGANPNARATRGQTALMWAVAQRHASVVKALIAGGADIHARTDGWSQMMAVPPHGLPEYNRLIPHGRDTALMFAARAGDHASAKLLIDAGANVDDQDAWGVSATILAAFAGHVDVVRLLLENGANPDVDAPGFTALHCAIMRRDQTMVAMLLDRGANPNAPVKAWTPTRRSSDDYHFMPALVGASPFWLAARIAHPGVMRLLAARGADTAVVHESHYVRGEGYQRRTERTTAVMAALGLGGGAPWVAWAGDPQALVLDAVKVAVELGVDVNAVNTDGLTALDAAKAQKFHAVAAFLESRGAVPGIK